MSLLDSFTPVATGKWQRDYLFKLTFPAMPALIQPKATLLGLTSENFDLYVLEAGAPGSKTQIKKMEWGGQWANFAMGLEGTGSGSFTCGMDEGAKSYELAYAWRQLAGNDSTGTSVPKSLYIGTMMMTMYSVDKVTPTLSITLENAWIAEIGELSLNKGGSDFLKFKVDIAWDRKSVTFPGNLTIK